MGTAAETTDLEITITEGRNRQVRRMLEAVGSKVLELARVRIGNLAIGDLPTGKWRDLAPHELRTLQGTPSVTSNTGKRATRWARPARPSR